MYHAESEASVQDGAMQYLINKSVKMGPRVGNGNPLSYSCLKNSMTEEPGGLHTVPRAAKSQMTEHMCARACTHTHTHTLVTY